MCSSQNNRNDTEIQSFHHSVYIILTNRLGRVFLVLGQKEPLVSPVFHYNMAWWINFGWQHSLCREETQWSSSCIEAFIISLIFKGDSAETGLIIQKHFKESEFIVWGFPFPRILHFLSPVKRYLNSI